MIERQCIDPQHIDVGPLSKGDFYASSKSVCKTCRKRYTAAVNKKIAERMKEGQPQQSFSRRPEETPEEEAMKLRQLEQFYAPIRSMNQHGASPEQQQREGREVFDFDLPKPAFAGICNSFLRLSSDRHIQIHVKRI